MAQPKGMFERMPSTSLWIALLGFLLTACDNSPYEAAADNKKVLYKSFEQAPRTLDPAVAYTTADSIITGNVFDTLLEFHYRKRPYELIPALAVEVPKPIPLDGGGVAFRFELRPGAEYHEDASFKPNPQFSGRRTRAVTSGDIAFALMRIADRKVNSPIASNFGAVLGFTAFADKLSALRKSDAGFDKLSLREQYRQAGGIAGIRTATDRQFEIVLTESDQQLLYWFAMPFTAPMPWEVVAYYDGKEGRGNLADHPVGSGPFRLAHYDKQFRMVLERNPFWYGARSPGAPGATFPAEGDRKDVELGRIDPAYYGKPMPFLDRVEFRRERERIPRFNKFLQGYFDSGSVINESFDAVIQDDRLSDEMKDLGIRLDKSIELSVFYIGFNMDDAVVGRVAGDKSRKLRQAMSLVIDIEKYLELFSNNRGVPAQSPIPPGLFGYDPEYRNPYRQVDIVRAKRLLAEAGYTNGVDPATGKPLKLTFDVGNTSARARLRYQFFVNAWRQLGINVELAATNYNRFQDKVRRGAYQVFTWGWIADYPDPENFLFLLKSDMARSEGEGPNSANFKNAEYDRLFKGMEERPNDARRAELIAQMRSITERERPWIELSHSEAYSLSHAWLKNTLPSGLFGEPYKYLDIDIDLRADLRQRWNEPVVWPFYLLLATIVIVIIPGVLTFYRERQ